MDCDGGAGLLADDPAEVVAHRQLVGAVAEGQEGGSERVPVDGAPDLDQASVPKKAADPGMTT